MTRVAHPPRWGDPRPGPLARGAAWLRSAFGGLKPAPRSGVPRLPVALRRGDLAVRYLAAERGSDHRRAGATAMEAMERALASHDWWPADIWAHRALWHFEQAELRLAATRAARRIGELRTAAGDPASARRYYAEAISEARDIGAEREEGLSALGLGQAMLDLGDVTTARRLAQIALDLLERCAAPAGELAAARQLRGREKRIGQEVR